MDGYIYLAIAIVEQAANDYRSQIKRHGEAPAIENFFRSDWGNLLCFGKASLVLEKLKNEQIPRKNTPFKRGMVPRNRKDEYL